MATRRVAAGKKAATSKPKTTKPKPVAKKKPTAKAKPAPKPKRTAKPKPAAGPSKREVLGPQVVKLRKEGLTWKEIMRKLKTDLPQIYLAYEYQVVKPAEKIDTSVDRKQLAKTIAVARDKDNVSWFKLQARTGMSQATLKKLYTEGSGKEANQGFDVMRRSIATRQAAKGSAVKTRTRTVSAGGKVTTKATPAKAKRAVARTQRKKATGTPNPSKA